MDLPLGVLAIYGALVTWVALLVYGMKRGSYVPFLGFGIALLLVLNVRYLIDGTVDSIAFFIGIYDVLDNLGVANTESAAALAKCPDNACTVWGDRYQNHPAWGVAFHDRFLNGPQFRSNLLYGHLTFNSIVFVLMHYQLYATGRGSNPALHKSLGRISFTFLTIATICAIWLASEHGPVGEYGGNLSTYGFYSMSFVVYGCAIMGIMAIRNGDSETHRVWMIRFVGSMWGSFWLFRAMLLVLGPLLRDYEAAALLICIWFSAPLGVLIAEFVRRRMDQRSGSSGVAAEAGSAS